MLRLSPLDMLMVESEVLAGHTGRLCHTGREILGRDVQPLALASAGLAPAGAVVPAHAAAAAARREVTASCKMQLLWSSQVTQASAPPLS